MLTGPPTDGRPLSGRRGYRSGVHPYAWSVDAEAVFLVPALTVGYLAAVQVFPAARPRVVAFLLGQLLLLAVFATPVETLALHYLLSAHLLQNVVLADWAPALCVAGLPPALATRLGRVPAVRGLTRPLVALPLWLATYFAWHVPWPYQTALEHPTTLLHLEHLSYLATGALLWWPVLHDAPRRLAAGAKAVYLFAAFVLASPLGLLLALLPRPIYDFYERAPRVWGLSALADQQLAGLSMASEEAIVFFALFAFFFLRFLSEEEPVLRLERARP